MPNGKGTSRAKRNGLAPPYCEVCGYDRAVTKHRILARRHGGRYLEKNGYVEGNVIALCRNCHWEADQMGLIPPELLYAIVKERLERGPEHPQKFEDSQLARRVRCIAAKRGRASEAPCCPSACCSANEQAGISAGVVAA